MTFEAASVKLVYLIGKGYTKEQISELLLQDLRGEVTEKKRFSLEFETQRETFSEALKKAMTNMNLNIHN